jgi:hypothetical protein
MFTDFAGSMAKFQYILKHCKKLICMDANLHPRTEKLVGLIRPGPVFKYINTYNVDHDYRIRHTKKLEDILFLLHAHVQDGSNNIALVTNSLKKAKALRQFLMMTCRVPDNDIMMYTSETPTAIKKKHFTNVDEYWSRYRFIIYSPTVLAGISFNIEHFSHIYGFFIQESCNAEMCYQMLRRVRNISSKTIYLHFEDFHDSTKYYYPVTREDVEKVMLTKREHLMKRFPGYGIDKLTYGYQPDMDIDYSKDFRYWITIYNIMFDNASKNNFCMHFLNIIRSSGINDIEYIPDASDGDFAKHCTMMYTEAKKVSARITATELYEAADLETDEYRDLCNKTKMTDYDMTRLEELAVKKYQLKEEIRVENLSMKEVQTYYHNDRILLDRLKRTNEIHDVEGNTWEAKVENMITNRYEQVSRLVDKGLVIDYHESENIYCKHQALIELIKNADFLENREVIFLPGGFENLFKHTRLRYPKVGSVSVEYGAKLRQLYGIICKEGLIDASLAIVDQVKHLLTLLKHVYMLDYSLINDGDSVIVQIVGHNRVVYVQNDEFWYNGSRSGERPIEQLPHVIMNHENT